MPELYNLYCSCGHDHNIIAKYSENRRTIEIKHRGCGHVTTIKILGDGYFTIPEESRDKRENA